jgi:hypothetical protein
VAGAIAAIVSIDSIAPIVSIVTIASIVSKVFIAFFFSAPLFVRKMLLCVPF